MFQKGTIRDLEHATYARTHRAPPDGLSCVEQHRGDRLRHEPMPPLRPLPGGQRALPLRGRALVSMGGVRRRKLQGRIPQRGDPLAFRLDRDAIAPWSLAPPGASWALLVWVPVGIQTASAMWRSLSAVI
jgi:hypothetical protein